MKSIKEYAQEIYSAFKKRHASKLRKLNDHILDDAMLDFETPYYEVAVLAYVLSKIISKPRYFRSEYRRGIENIEKTINQLTKIRYRAGAEEILPQIRKIETMIARLESRDPRFMIDLISKGRLKMAATLYAKGMSLGIASGQSGIDKQDILEYAGQTMMFDRMKEEKDILQRMKDARQFLGI